MTHVTCYHLYNIYNKYKNQFKPGRVAVRYTCLTADPGVASSIPARSPTFVEIDHKIISTPFSSLALIQEGLLSVKSERICMKYWLTA